MCEGDLVGGRGVQSYIILLKLKFFLQFHTFFMEFIETQFYTLIRFQSFTSAEMVSEQNRLTRRNVFKRFHDKL